MSSLTSALRYRVTIEEPVTVSDGGGGFTTTWEEVADVFASIASNGHTREGVEHNQLRSGKRLKVAIRYRDDLDTSMRIVFDDKYFDIRSTINPDMKKIMLELDLEEQVL